MRKLLFLIMLTPLPLVAQNKGIQFEKGANLEKIKTKARSENKYIFLDCFATWCGPCKQMDKDVFSNDTVGNFFNEKFVSVKIQMDKTEKDNEEVQSWRKDADIIAKQYRIQAYPTYIFLSPNGLIVHKETGFKPPIDFISVAETAIAPGKAYDDPYQIYDQLLADYKKGKKDYSKMPYMVRTAILLADTETANVIAKDYSNYVVGLRDKELYSQENIEFFTSVISSKSKFFNLFFPDGSKIDAALNKKGYAQNIVDKVILNEEVEPFIKMRTGGMQMMGAKPKAVPEPEWNNLYKIIKKKFDINYAERNILEAKIIWNEGQQNLRYTKYFIEKWEKYGLDTTDSQTDLRLNQVAWDIFNKVNDKEQIESAINWMQGVVKRSERKNIAWNAATTDTYASLLYKAGKKDKAIQIEERAVSIAETSKYKPLIAELQERANQMKKGQPTWSSK